VEGREPLKESKKIEVEGCCLTKNLVTWVGWWEEKHGPSYPGDSRRVIVRGKIGKKRTGETKNRRRNRALLLGRIFPLQKEGEGTKEMLSSPSGSLWGET